MKTHKKKIAFFIPNLGGGGAERVFVKLANYFRAEGFKIDMVLSRKEGALLKLLKNDINVFDLNARRGFMSIISLICYIRKEKPDFMLTAMAHSNAAAIWARVFFGRSFVLLPTEHIHYSLASGGRNVFSRKIITFLMSKTYKKVEKVIAVSSGIKEDLAKSLNMPEAKISLIYDPVFDESILSGAKEEINHPFFGSRVILGAGRLTEQKDFKTLIEAFALVKSRISDAKLIILGEGEKRKELESLVETLNLKGDVAFLGFVENPYPYMLKSSVFALSSRWEGFGVVLVEALACGTPVVSTDCPSGPAEILLNGKFGKLVPPADPEILANAIIEALDEKAEPDFLAGRARDFSVEKIAGEYLDAMKEFSREQAGHGK